MKSYRCFFKMAPNVGPTKLLVLTGNSLTDARHRAEDKLCLRYPHYVIVRTEQIVCAPADLIGRGRR